MRILTLGFDAFGPFTNLELDLSAGVEGFHIIYGPNEAGKTSALRAIRQLFFGIDAQTSDNFVHEYPRLRLRAALRDSKGKVLQFTRRKGNKNVLQAPDGSPLAESELSEFLSGVDQATYKSLFSMGHDELVQGGEEIVSGKGEAGELIFAAGTGLLGLRRLQTELQGESEKLFKPRGNQRIGSAVLAWQEARKEQREFSVSGEKYLNLEAELQQAQILREERHRERLNGKQEASRLSRFRDALPSLSIRREALLELKQFEDLPRLPDDFGEQWRKAQEEVENARREVERLEAEAEHYAKLAESIQVRGELLDEAETIERLHDRLGKYEAGQSDRPKLLQFQQEHEHQVRERLRKIGRDPAQTDLELLRLRAGTEETLTRLVQDKSAQEASRRKALDDLRRRQAMLAACEVELEQLQEPPDTSALALAVEETKRLGKTEADLAELEADRDERKRLVEAKLATLSGWSESIDQLARLKVPLSESIDRFEQLEKDFEQRRSVHEFRYQEKKKERESLEERLRALELQHEVPTEQDLAQARIDRDALWQQVRQAWFSPAEAPPDADPLHLARAYEESVLRADELSDRMRREATQVAEKANCQARQETLRRDLEDLSAKDQELEQEQARLKTEFRELVRELGPTVHSPAEARAWCRLREEILLAHDQFRVREMEALGLASRIQTQCAQLKDALSGVGSPPPESACSLAQILSYAESVLTSLNERREARNERLRERKRILKERDEATQALEGLEGLGSELAEKWAAAIEPLGLPPTAEPEQVMAYVRAIREAFEQQDKAKGFLSRIQGIDRDLAAYAAEVRKLCEKVAPELVENSPADSVRSLSRLVDDARDKHASRERANDEAEKRRKRRADADERLRASQQILDRLCREAGVDRVEDLLAVDRRWQARREAESRLHQAEEALRPLAGGMTLEAFDEEAATIDPDGIAARLESLQVRDEQLDREIQELDQRIGELKNELARIDGSDRAAEAEERAEALAAQLQVEIPRYMTLKLASLVLSRGIERYRKQNQNPILEQAGRHFAELTAGSFVGLEVDQDRDRTVIVGIRSGSEAERVYVDGMSKGTCDQLYLALRLASLDRWLDKHEPVPMVLDDLLLHFDDRRAKAALRILNKLSEKVQILFFTHHRHILDLAREALDPSSYQEHELASRG